VARSASSRSAGSSAAMPSSPPAGELMRYPVPLGEPRHRAAFANLRPPTACSRVILAPAAIAPRLRCKKRQLHGLKPTAPFGALRMRLASAPCNTTVRCAALLASLAAACVPASPTCARMISLHLQAETLQAALPVAQNGHPIGPTHLAGDADRQTVILAGMQRFRG